MSQRVIKLERKPYSNHVTLLYEDGSSDYLRHPETRIKLLSLRVKDPDKVLDYIWNFHVATVKIDFPDPVSAKSSETP